VALTNLSSWVRPRRAFSSSMLQSCKAVPSPRRLMMADDIQSVHMTDHVDASKAMYDERASGYDASNGGWHVDLGLDFVRWTAPKKGAHVLDLACDSGLVTYPAAQAVGPEGFVVGVDVSTGMLQEAKRKSALQGSGRIKWVEHDISNLDNVEVVQQVVQSGGFDLIMCCSALVLLANPASSIIVHFKSL
jgi:ubiquinone/menaquinone biosynthesis C-methylase UbiE